MKAVAPLEGRENVTRASEAVVTAARRWSPPDDRTLAVGGCHRKQRVYTRRLSPLYDRMQSGIPWRLSPLYDRKQSGRYEGGFTAREPREPR